MRLHGYVQSSATRRVELALALKGLDASVLLSDMPDLQGCGSAGLRINLQGLRPVLELADGRKLTQSLAILEWLEELWPTPPLLPPDPLTRAQVRAFAMATACDAHPLHSPRVLARLRGAGMMEGEAQGWARNALREGLEACEALADENGPFSFGEAPGLADVCLVPQLAVARQFGVHLAFPRLLAAEAACLTLPAFRQIFPEKLNAE